ncbi:Cyanovirin-N [Fusarium venenatum]|uniref:Cyanovirin-N n=1 Tax=Fusarium venenatum TaxID=56646 RepID=UPI001D520FBA|nr:Cyanovirin-N [Fusarium venenatum]
MKINTLALLALGSLGVVADSDFAATCQDYGVHRPGGNANYPQDRTTFQASCRKINGAWSVAVFINISKLFANDEGNLVARLNSGGMGGSCRDLRMKGTVLHARCVNYSGGTTDTSIDLNRHIANRDGILTYHGGPRT